MVIWLPYVTAGTGTDVFTRTLAESLAERGHDVHVTPFRHWWQYAPWRLRLARVPAGTHIVLANSWNAFAFRRTGIPLVSVEHLLVLDPALKPYRTFAQATFHKTLVHLFERQSADQADAIVAVSAYTAHQLQQHLGVPAPKVIHNGIDTQFFQPPIRPASGSGIRPMRLLFVGTLSRRKGADLLPQIMQRLGPGFELRFTGGDGGNKLVRPGPGVIPIGHLDRKALRTAYQDADLLLFPTRLEGLGLVALEAMACGTPVVASRTGPLTEIVEDGINGRLCPVDDVKAFTDAIRQLRADPEQLSKMGTAARGTAETGFSIDRMTDEYVALFEQLTR